MGAAVSWVSEAMTYGFAAYGVWCFGLRLDDWFAARRMKGSSDAEE
jgi:hypothetical protein